MWTTSLVIAASLASAVLCNCPNGWTRENDICYIFVENELNWHDAGQHCEILESHLARLETKQQSDAIQTLLLERHRFDNSHSAIAYWIDGNDLAIDGDWVYAHNVPITYFDWAPGQPDNYGHTQQGCMNLYGPLQYKMDDGHCTKTQPYICELPDPRYETGIIG